MIMHSYNDTVLRFILLSVWFWNNDSSFHIILPCFLSICDVYFVNCGLRSIFVRLKRSCFHVVFVCLQIWANFYCQFSLILNHKRILLVGIFLLIQDFFYIEATFFVCQLLYTLFCVYCVNIAIINILIILYLYKTVPLCRCNMYSKAQL